MIARVFFIQLSDAQRAWLNSEGWDSEIGHAYEMAKEGIINRHNFHLFQLAAVIDDDAYVVNEDVWLRLQNMALPWTEQSGGVRCCIDFARSMDVGDVIAWDDGDVYRCDTIGFVKLDAWPITDTANKRSLHWPFEAQESS